MLTAADLRTYVINLPRRTDRRERMRAVLPSELRATFTSDWNGPFDGHQLTRGELDTAGYRLFPWQDTTSENPWWNRPLKYGEIACTLAHHACWSHARDYGSEPYILILEDDAVPVPRFVETLLEQLHRTAEYRCIELLYLGRDALGPDMPVRPGVVEPGYSHCTYGYVLSRAALDAVLDAHVEQALVPVDEFLPALYHNHPRADLRERFPRRLKALAFEPPLVTQLPKEEAGSDTENSPFVDDPRPVR
ncbi:glycosyltransferase family 25 protein [Saccharopolyspora endophytica]|uniref:Glycosyltransferase family 25 protein n=1 Tax=Saccharopolyspora endophytica TaxID=543886 RepID=A0ABS5DQU2_9PSEU|nr:glycosyltransferase family 25 protein [Saccharopolyspora endophytica]MBQ0928637.1 glycosyltransferase family 25 protein [Saccharopolyspora endophytica]